MLQIVLFAFITISTVYSDDILGGRCISNQTNYQGTCKLLTECEEARNELVVHQRLPQVCGFQGTRPVVCCTKSVGTISKQKCKEYSTYASKGCNHKITKRIVGGITAKTKEFPHMAALGYQKNPQNPKEITWSCGGSVISQMHILTVARCIHREDTLKYVSMGVTNLNDLEHRQVIKIAQIIIHPDYKKEHNRHNIGIIKLEEPIQFSDYVRPACVYTEKEIHSEKAEAIGWGNTEFPGGLLSDDLLKVTLNFVDTETCNKSYGINRRLPNGIEDSFICMYTEGKDTCQGDSGGPLQIEHTEDNIKCMFDIVGLTSFGKACALGVPSVYTKVSHYVDWIEKTVWPKNI